MHDLDVQQHRAQQPGDPADDVDADLQRPTAAQRLELLDERGERRPRVVDAAAEHDPLSRRSMA